MRALLLCVVLVCCGNAKDCLSQEQIDSKHYAIKIAKEHGEFQEVFNHVAKVYGTAEDSIGIFRVQEYAEDGNRSGAYDAGNGSGEDFAIISFGQMGDIRKIEVFKNTRYASKAAVYNDGKPTQEAIEDSQLSSEYLGGTLLEAYQQSEGLIQWVALIQFDAQKSEYVFPMVRFTFENGASVSIAINEYMLESDVFYDKQGGWYEKCGRIR